MRKRLRKLPVLDFTNFTPVEVYDYLVSGKILKFPNGFVTPDNMREIIREVILMRQKLTRNEICNNISVKYLRKYNLGGAVKVFHTNIFELVNYCFDEMDIKPWELNKLENGFWQNNQNRKEFLLWIAKKEKIDLKSIDDLKKINAKLIRKYGGSRILKCKGGIFENIKLVAKIDIKQWQVMKNVVWNDEKVKEAVRWLIEEKLNWSHDEVVEKLSVKTFRDNNLGGMLCKYCNNSPIRALYIAYPGEYSRVRRTILK